MEASAPLTKVNDTPLWALLCKITVVSSLLLLSSLYALETTVLLTESFSRTGAYSKPWMRALGGLGVSQSYGLFGSVEQARCHARSKALSGEVRRELVIRELREGQWREIRWRCLSILYHIISCM